MPVIPTIEMQEGIIPITCMMNEWLADGAQMIQIYEDVAKLSLIAFTSKRDGSLELDSLGAGSWTNPMIHRILSWRPMIPIESRDTMIQEVFRLGLLLYMAPIWRWFGVAPVLTTKLVQNLVIFLDSNVIDWPPGSWRIKLWAVYMGACEALDSSHEAWYCNQIMLILREREMESWSLAVDHVYNFLWAEPVFAKRDSRLSTLIGILMRR
jgi:hypothetical protein